VRRRRAAARALASLPLLAVALVLGSCGVYFGLGGSKVPSAGEARAIAVRNVGRSFERRGCRVPTELLPDTFAGPTIPYTPRDAQLTLLRMARDGLIREEGAETVYLEGECRPGPRPAPEPVPPGTVAPRPAR
jgi:hypothetical protein